MNLLDNEHRACMDPTYMEALFEDAVRGWHLSTQTQTLPQYLGMDDCMFTLLMDGRADVDTLVQVGELVL